MLFLAFKKYSTIKSFGEKTEDDLRLLQQKLQQDADALADNAQAIRISKFKNMRDSQVKRNNDVKVINLFDYFFNILIQRY